MLYSVVCVLALVSLCSSQQYDQAFPFFGFEFVSANTTFLDRLEGHHGTLYTAGEGLIHQVLTTPTFEVSAMPFFKQNVVFMDFDTFVDPATNNSFAIGPIPNIPAANSNGPIQPSYPLQLVGQMSGTFFPREFLSDGSYMMAAVKAQVNHTTNQVNAYWVGYHQHHNTSNGVSLCVIRTVVYPSGLIDPVFQYNHTNGDRVYLPTFTYMTYDQIVKPTLFHSLTHNHLIVVDPASNCIFRVNTPTDFSQPLSYDGNPDQYCLTDNPNMQNEKIMQMGGSDYDPINHILYIGLQARGYNPGHIYALNVTSMIVIQDYQLQPYQSYPRALALDHTLNTLYVGLDGGPVILQLNLQSNAPFVAYTVSGYATVPIFLRNIWDLKPESDGFLYFITNEQHSKVARVPYQNFCATPCDMFYGYCNAGACACIQDMQLTANNRCQYAQTPAKAQDKSHAGEVALGILFAIALVAAAVGWFLIYKWKKSGSLENVGLLNNRA